MENINIEWVVGEGEAHTLVEEFERHDAKVSAPQPFRPSVEAIEDFTDAHFEPLMIVAVSLSAGFLIKRIVDVWLDLKHQGTLVVDTRGEQLQVRTEVTGDRGTLVVVDSKGARVYQQKRKDEAVEALRAVVEAAGGG